MGWAECTPENGDDRGDNHKQDIFFHGTPLKRIDWLKYLEKFGGDDPEKSGDVHDHDDDGRSLVTQLLFRYTDNSGDQGDATQASVASPGDQG